LKPIPSESKASVTRKITGCIQSQITVLEIFTLSRRKGRREMKIKIRRRGTK
jgi:hypothetical protein